MEWNLAKIRQTWEKLYPYILTLILLLFIYMLPELNAIDSVTIESIKNKLFSNDFLAAIMTVESILLGFLLAVLTLTLQADTPNIKQIKHAGRFHELVAYNRHAVTTSFLAAITSMLVIITYPQPCNAYLFFLYFWGGCLLLSIFTTCRFFNIFYALIK